MNLTLTLPAALREVSIDGEAYMLVKRSALDALYANGAARPNPDPPAPASTHARVTRITRKAKPGRKATRTAAHKARKIPKARPAAELETGKRGPGALRNAVLAEIQQNPGRTSLEIFEQINAKLPTTSGSVYTAIKSWVDKRVVEGRATEDGPKSWYPRAA